MNYSSYKRKTFQKFEQGPNIYPPWGPYQNYKRRGNLNTHLNNSRRWNYRAYPRSFNNLRPPYQQHKHNQIPTFKQPQPQVKETIVTPSFPGSEEYMQRNIEQKSAQLKKILNMEGGSSIPAVVNKENSIEHINEARSLFDTSQGKVLVETTSKTRRASPRKKIQSVTMNVKQIYDKIVHHIASLSYQKQNHLTNNRQIQKEKRLEVSRKLREMSLGNLGDNEKQTIYNILPDIDIKIENLSKEVMLELSETLCFHLEDSLPNFKKTEPLFENYDLTDEIDSKLLTSNMNIKTEVNYIDEQRTDFTEVSDWDKLPKPQTVSRRIKLKRKCWGPIDTSAPIYDLTSCTPPVNHNELKDSNSETSISSKSVVIKEIADFSNNLELEALNDLNISASLSLSHAQDENNVASQSPIMGSRKARLSQKVDEPPSENKMKIKVKSNIFVDSFCDEILDYEPSDVETHDDSVTTDLSKKTVPENVVDSSSQKVIVENLEQFETVTGVDDSKFENLKQMCIQKVENLCKSTYSKRGRRKSKNTNSKIDRQTQNIDAIDDNNKMPRTRRNSARSKKIEDSMLLSNCITKEKANDANCKTVSSPLVESKDPPEQIKTPVEIMDTVQITNTKEIEDKGKLPVNNVQISDNIALNTSENNEHLIAPEMSPKEIQRNVAIAKTEEPQNSQEIKKNKKNESIPKKKRGVKEMYEAESEGKKEAIISKGKTTATKRRYQKKDLKESETKANSKKAKTEEKEKYSRKRHRTESPENGKKSKHQAQNGIVGGNELLTSEINDVKLEPNCEKERNSSKITKEKKLAKETVLEPKESSPKQKSDQIPTISKEDETKKPQTTLGKGTKRRKRQITEPTKDSKETLPEEGGSSAHLQVVNDSSCLSCTCNRQPIDYTNTFLHSSIDILQQIETIEKEMLKLGKLKCDLFKQFCAVFSKEASNQTKIAIASSNHHKRGEKRIKSKKQKLVSNERAQESSIISPESNNEYVINKETEKNRAVKVKFDFQRNKKSNAASTELILNNSVEEEKKARLDKRVNVEKDNASLKGIINPIITTIPIIKECSIHLERLNYAIPNEDNKLGNQDIKQNIC